MSTEWSTVRSFESSQRLLSAINTISIAIKLKRAGITQHTSENLAQPRQILVEFLARLKQGCEEATGEAGTAFLGTDDGRRRLYSSFLAARRTPRTFRSPLFRGRIAELLTTVESDDISDSDDVLQSLAELRVLVEQNIHVDKRRLLGEL